MKEKEREKDICIKYNKMHVAVKTEHINLFSFIKFIVHRANTQYLCDLHEYV